MRDLVVDTLDERRRVRAVWHLYARRGGQTASRDRTYTLYIVALIAVLYLGPTAYLARTSPVFAVDGSTAGIATGLCLLAVAGCWAAQLAGHFAGPLVVRPFLLHVFTSTDLSPTSYLGTIARRRLAGAALAMGLTAGIGVFVTTDLLDHATTAPLVTVAALGSAALFAAAWLWGQVRSMTGQLALAAAVPLLAAACGALAGRYGEPWLVSSGLVVAAAVVGWDAYRAIARIDLSRLARESARAAEAQLFAGTGTLHHALELYRPEPRGLTSVLLRADGRLRGQLARGAVRALRAPGRAVAALTALVAGGASTAWGVSGADGPVAAIAWTTGAVVTYLGAGWAGDTWRGLRDELTMPPLLGEDAGGTLLRGLAWPLTVTTAGSSAGGAAVLLATGATGTALVLLAATVLLALAARLMREMKSQLPPGLLLPIVTPFGDLSGLRVLMWQFDSIAVLVLSVGVLDLVASPGRAAILTVVIAGGCVWAAAHRTGWAHRGLLSRLRRA